MDWIRTKDELPEKRTEVLVYNNDDGINVSFISERKEAWYFEEMYKPFDFFTHWMTLPEPPEEESTLSETNDISAKEEPRYYPPQYHGIRLNCVTCGSPYVIFMPHGGYPSDKCRFCFNNSEERDNERFDRWPW